ncbi:hypothetical protein [Bacillus sp. EAC]|uniref:hypothetical protein n=1 Tax=Bacillus sp. EAC TaxID=1978338 RepID=UPI000B44E31F|nr:hypothetical protein [Bacillus sp. EAC]
MYVGRDLAELSMTSKTEWKDSELEYFHHSFQQITGYLNVEGNMIQKEIIKEIESRGGLQRNEADWNHGTRQTFD